MVISLGKWWSRFKFMVIFIITTMFFYHLLHLISGWLEPINRYQEPKGEAVKAFQQEFSGQKVSIINRLRFFYWYGE